MTSAARLPSLLGGNPRRSEDLQAKFLQDILSHLMMKHSGISQSPLEVHPPPCVVVANYDQDVLESSLHLATPIIEFAEFRRCCMVREVTCVD
jgi:hypothetical protein